MFSRKHKTQKKMAKSLPFATKSGTNAKMALFSSLSIASSIAGASYITKRRQSLSAKALAKSAEKLKSQIEKAASSIDLRDHPEAGDAMNQTKEKLGWMSHQLDQVASSQPPSKTYAYAGDGS